MNKLDNLGFHIIEDYELTDERAIQLSSSEIHENYENAPEPQAGHNAPSDEVRAVRLSSSEIHENYENPLNLQEEDFYLMEEAPPSPQAFSSSQFGRIFSEVGSAFNNHTTHRGTQMRWDANRLKQGKLKSFEEIGGERLTLQTPQSNLDATYFSPSQFFQATGAVPTSLHLEVTNPLINSAELLSIDIPERTNNNFPRIPSARIQYNSEQKDAFKHADELLTLCQMLNLVPIWEENSKPIEPFELRQRSPENKSILLISRGVYAQDFKGKENPLYTIHPPIEGSETLPLFGQRCFSSTGFKMNREILPTLDELKLQSTPYGEPVNAFNQTIYINKYQNLNTFIRFNEFLNLPFVKCHLETHALPQETGGAVVLSMNQTNSYTQFSDEILTFLMMGMHVLAYDNASKGLSTGMNSQDELTNAVIAAGNFLIEEKGFRQKRIVFKGQCAGGLPTASVASLFRTAHFWIDQAPNNFAGAAKNALKNSFVSESTNFMVAQTLNSIFSIAGTLSSFALPNFDVITQLKKNVGIQIYTIGVPTPNNLGGDTLVPDSHKEQFAEYLNENRLGHYLQMPGATHVTHWWYDQKVYKDIQRIFNEGTHLRPEIFTKDYVYKMKLEKPHKCQQLGKNMLKASLSIAAAATVAIGAYAALFM